MDSVGRLVLLLRETLGRKYKGIPLRLLWSEGDVKRANPIMVATEPSQDGRQAARVFALAMGILFSIIFVMNAITF
jgi:hypothetical protein